MMSKEWEELKQNLWTIQHLWLKIQFEIQKQKQNEKNKTHTMERPNGTNREDEGRQ